MEPLPGLALRGKRTIRELLLTMSLVGTQVGDRVWPVTFMHYDLG